MFVFDTGNMFNPRYVINFPTKRHWRGNSRIEDIESGLVALIEEVRTREIKSIAIPPLGSGLGGLDWQVVKPLITSAFEALPEVKVILYEPGQAPSAREMTKAVKTPNMTKGRAAMIGLMRKYRAAAMDPEITLLEIHKLMYFMVAVGEPIRNMKYKKGPYGPYSENLHHVLNTTEGHFTLGFADGGEKPDKPLTILDGAIEKAEQALEAESQTHENFSRVTDLIAGFETPFGMELLATVHWVASEDGACNSREALKCIGEWSPRKRELFTERHVDIAWDILQQHELVKVN
jgi:O-acetyl-ADP-ribose deacetylase (regulator of RNase III)